MKLQLDTTEKTIRIDENINLYELVEAIKKLLPNGLWKEFTIEANSIIYWTQYPIITYPLYPVVPTLPWMTTSGTITDNTTSTITYKNDTLYTLTSGVYNIALNE